jgi:hypothetical protein
MATGSRKGRGRQPRSVAFTDYPYQTGRPGIAAHQAFAPIECCKIRTPYARSSRVLAGKPRLLTDRLRHHCPVRHVCD